MPPSWAPYVFTALGDADKHVRIAAVTALPSLGPAALEAIDRVAARAGTPDECGWESEAMVRLRRPGLAALALALAPGDARQYVFTVGRFPKLAGPAAAPVMLRWMSRATGVDRSSIARAIEQMKLPAP